MSDDFDFSFPRGRNAGTTARRTTTPRKRTPKKTLRTPAEIEEAFTKQLTDLAQYLNLAGKVGHNDKLVRDAQIVTIGSENFAKSWSELAEQDKRVHAAVDAFISATSWSTAVGATAAIIVPILINHGLLPQWFKSDVPRPTASVIPLHDDEVPREDAGHVDAL